MLKCKICRRVCKFQKLFHITNISNVYPTSNSSLHESLRITHTHAINEAMILSRQQIFSKLPCDFPCLSRVCRMIASLRPFPVGVSAARGHPY